MLTDFAAAGAAAENHMHHAFSAAFRSYTGPFSVKHLEGGGVHLVTGQPHPMGNFAIGPDGHEVAGLADSLRGTALPSALFFPGHVPDGVDEVLTSKGFSNVGAMPAMAVNLDTLTVPVLADGYRFEACTDDEGVEWTNCFAAGFEIPQPLADLFSPVTVPPSPDILYFRALKGDETASVSMMFLAEGVAGIYCVATHPDHRNRGLGAYVTAEPLRRAREHGYRIGVLQASQMGYPVYKRLGFEDVGAVHMYFHIPGA